MAAQGIKDLNLKDTPPALAGNDDPQDIDMEEEEEDDANPKFAVTPGHITQGVLGYSTSKGRKIYYKEVQLFSPIALGEVVSGTAGSAQELPECSRRPCP